ncbi:MAG: sigma-70 family RNA polymerase sigma factor [Pirellulaceae bacterium]|nr:sigma-70 family RNA polymerase sigma factor [Pirellulaceae bacterium]
MNGDKHHDLFSELIAQHQSELYAYIFAIVRNWQDADDLFQDVCMVLWRKFETFRPGSSFFSWARQTAKLEVRNFLRRKKSSTYVNEQVLDVLAEMPIDARDDETKHYLAALRRCGKKLVSTDKQMLVFYYVENLGSRQIADRLDRPQSSVCNSLKRIHRWLLECVEKELKREEYLGGERND